MLSKLYGELDIGQTYKFEDLHSWLLEATSADEYREAIVRYRGILKLAKAEIPQILKREAN